MKPEKITQMQQAGEVWWYSHHQMEVLQKRIAELEDEELKTARAYVDSAIIAIVLPQAYSIIDRMLSTGAVFPKDLVVEARRLLPEAYANSFSSKPTPYVKKP